MIRDGDVIVTMGAGNISAVSHALPEAAGRAAAAGEGRVSVAVAPEFARARAPRTSR